jgi:esterase/lipase
MKRRNKLFIAVAVAIATVLLGTTPARLDYVPLIDEIPDLQALLLETQADLVPGTEKRLTWHDEEQQTEWSVVALHGFSASRQESAPLAELVAKRLGANLFETRFSGHGLKTDALVDVSAEAWLDDVANALTIGHLIGQKIVVIAISNGAALALSMLDHPTMQSVDSLILLSPNFGPADPKAMWITGPGGPLLLRIISGETRSWEAHNELQEKYWTTSYPSRTLVQVIRVVDRARAKIETEKAPRLQVYFSPDDEVISVAALQSAFAVIQSPQKELIPVPETDSPSSHILAGDIMSPTNTIPIAEKISDFILRPIS